jgi:hypothetical protein
MISPQRFLNPVFPDAQVYSGNFPDGRAFARQSPTRALNLLMYICSSERRSTFGAVIFLHAMSGNRRTAFASRIAPAEAVTAS